MTTIRDFTGAYLIRAELTDGRKINVNDDEMRRPIAWGDVKLRAMPQSLVGHEVDVFLYRALGLDPHRFVFDLPGSVYGTGSHRSGAGGHAGGDKEGFVFRRGDDGRKEGDPVGRIFFMTSDRRLREVDPQDRQDFEALR